MNIDESTKIVMDAVKQILQNDNDILEDMLLIGGDSQLDSMKLVELCLSLEDAAEVNGFEFNWTSEEAMSKSRSMFRSVKTLAEEFSKQSEN